jgi:hypothetical protein
LDEDFKLDQQTLEVIYRFAVEEILRRSMKADADTLSKTQILKILFPNYEKFVTDLMVIREKEIRDEAKAACNRGGNEND